MPTLDTIIQTNIVQSTTAVTQQGFGIPLILGTTGFPCGSTDKFRTYHSLTAVASDFATSTPEYKAAQSLMASPTPVPTFLIGQRTAGGNVASIQTITLAGDLITGNTISITVNGVVCSVTYATSMQATMTALATAIAAVTGVASAVLGATPYRVITVTATAGYDVILTALSITGGASQVTGTLATTTPGVTAATDLAAILAQTSIWYYLIQTSHAVPDVLSAAAWVEANGRAYGTSTNDANALVSGNTSHIGYMLKAAGYNRTNWLYSAVAGTVWPEAAWAGVCLPYTPGSETWMFKQLPGVTVDTLTPSQSAAVQANNGNTYETVAGVNMTSPGVMASGRFIDQPRGADWLKAEMQTRIFSRFANLAKVPYTDAGVAILENEMRGALALGITNGLLTDNPAPTVSAPKVATESVNNRANRLFPDLTFTANFAGAIHGATINGVVAV